MKPGSSEAVAAESQSSQASKAKLSSAKPDEIKPDKAAAAKAKPISCKKSLTWSEKYYARPSDIYECFVVDGKVWIMYCEF